MLSSDEIYMSLHYIVLFSTELRKAMFCAGLAKLRFATRYAILG